MIELAIASMSFGSAKAGPLHLRYELQVNRLMWLTPASDWGIVSKLRFNRPAC